jgi:hypothetical protein
MTKAKLVANAALGSIAAALMLTMPGPAHAQTDISVYESGSRRITIDWSNHYMAIGSLDTPLSTLLLGNFEEWSASDSCGVDVPEGWSLVIPIHGAKQAYRNGRQYTLDLVNPEHGDVRMDQNGGPRVALRYTMQSGVTEILVDSRTGGPADDYRLVSGKGLLQSCVASGR